MPRLFAIHHRAFVAFIAFIIVIAGFAVPVPTDAQGVTCRPRSVDAPDIDSLRSALTTALDTAHKNTNWTTINLSGGVDYDVSTGSGTLNLEGGDCLITIQTPATEKSAILDGKKAVQVLKTNSNTGLFLVNVTIENGIAFDYGGGINNDGALTLINSTVTHNVVFADAGKGGGISNDDTLTIINSTISNNAVFGVSDAEGGGIWNIYYNAINDFGAMDLVNSTVSGNVVSTGSGGSSMGGGVYAVGPARIRNSTISGNSSLSGSNGTSEGGGLVNSTQGFFQIINSTLYGNMASAGSGGTSRGGAAFSQPEAYTPADQRISTLVLANSTVSGNSAYTAIDGQSAGGGIYDGDITVFFSTIIANNSAATGRDVASAYDAYISSRGYNVIGDTNDSRLELLDTDQVGDPHLGPLQFNGGPTFTLAINYNSLAFQKGNCAGRLFGYSINLPGIPAVTTDQTGKTRKTAPCDVGAFEVGAIRF